MDFFEEPIPEPSNETIQELKVSRTDTHLSSFDFFDTTLTHIVYK